MIAKINLQSLEDPGTHQKYTSSQIKSVVHLCSSYMESGLDLENCVDILSLADTFSLQKLRPQVLRYMSENLSQLTGTSEFLRLDSGQLISLLNSNFPINMSESEVLAAAAKWLEHDLAARLGLADRVVEGVRLADIPS